MTKIKIIILFCLIVIAQSYAQNYENCVDSLYSENYGAKVIAIECVNYFKPEGAIDVLVELIDTQQPFLQIQFLNALYTLEYENVETEAHELIARADGFYEDPEYPWDPLDAKVFATAILVYKGDYSTIEYIFEQLYQDEITLGDALPLEILSIIMKNVPSYREESKNILLGELNNDSEEIRYFVILYLAQEFGEEMNNELIEKFVDDSDLPTRTLALQYLCINNYSELNSLLKEQLELEEEPSLRIDIADSLLLRFGEPSDLKAVIDYQPNEPDETARSLMGYAIDEFISPKPENLDYYGLCTRLITYTDEMFVYDWIQNEETRDYYSQMLTVVYESIESTGEIGDACSVIDERILQQLEQDLAEELITIEGYKFLHYYTIYIKEEIEEEYGPCP